MNDQLFIQPNRSIHSIHDVYVNCSFTSVNESSGKKCEKKTFHCRILQKKECCADDDGGNITYYSPGVERDPFMYIFINMCRL